TMPDWKAEIRTRLVGLQLTPAREAAIVEELAQFLDDHYAELLSGGVTSAEAERQTRAELSGSELLARELRRAERRIHQEPVALGTNRRTNMLADLWQDLRYGARMLLKNPGFTLIATLTLALGIGANTAIFSVVNAVLLHPLPFKEPDRLVTILEMKLPQFRESTANPGNFLDWKKQNTVFERLVAYTTPPFNLVGTGDPEQLRGMKVTDGFFAMLGAQPLLGRDFLPEEDRTGRNNVVILSHGLWQRRFGAAANIVNQTLTLSGQSYTVIGVMPATFQFGGLSLDLWTPMAFTAQDAQNHLGHFLAGILGQLKPGVTLEQARAEMTAIAERLAAQYPDTNTGWSVKLMPLLEFTVRSIKRALLVLLGAVAFVLLIACANVANLLLARAAGRQKEIALRTALGAGRLRIIRQLLTESALLAAVGGAVGLLLAKGGMDLLLKLSPQNLPRMNGVSLDGRALAFTAAITLLTGLIFGLVPALPASKPNLNEAMKDAGRGSTEGARRQFVRNTLVVLEVASALAPLVGAGLLIKSFWQLQKVDPGFNPDNALTASVTMPRPKYQDNVQRVAFFQQLAEKVSALPSVQAAGILTPSTAMPLSGGYVQAFEIQGRPPLPPGANQNTNFYAVNTDFFKAMGIPLLRGRLLTERDAGDAPRVAVVNETMAKNMFPDEDPLGRRIAFTGSSNPEWYEIVGVVGDVKQYGLDQPTPMQTYEPYVQQPPSSQALSSMTLVVRTSGDPTNFTAAIRNAVLQVDKEQPLSNVRTLDQLLSTSIAQRRFSMLLLGVFAAVALVLAAVGIYGVLNYAVTQRMREIGIRMALGAGQRDVLKLVVSHGMLLTLLGVAAGLAGAFALTRLLTTLLFGVSPTDPLTFAVIALLLALVALLACWIPARRATRVDPIVTLRSE
ncbi:MAG TPA: ABC transporter permease, partial [Blastocatellia bacterium]|nr:ABC transporter permease [Blastocatellia bacterium]